MALRHQSALERFTISHCLFLLSMHGGLQIPCVEIFLLDIKVDRSQEMIYLLCPLFKLAGTFSTYFPCVKLLHYRFTISDHFVR